MHKQMEFHEDEKVQLIKLDCAYGIVSGEGSREYVFFCKLRKADRQ